MSDHDEVIAEILASAEEQAHELLHMQAAVFVAMMCQQGVPEDTQKAIVESAYEQFHALVEARSRMMAEREAQGLCPGCGTDHSELPEDDHSVSLTDSDIYAWLDQG